MGWVSVSRCCAVAVMASMFAASAHAGQITQNISLNQNFGDFTPYSITGNPFDPTMGTLTGVSATFSGTYTPSVYDAFGPSPGTLTTTFFTNLGSGFPITAGTQTVVPTGDCAPSQTSGGCTYTGMPTAFNLSPAITLPWDNFISTAPGPVDFGYFGFNSHVAGAGGGGSDDTSFIGNLELTYDYSVPEPAGLLLLLSGLVGLLVVRRGRPRPIVQSALG